LTGDTLAAREHAESAIARCRKKRTQSFSEIAADLAFAYAALGDETAARTLAAEAAAAAVDDAWRMPADLAEMYLALPFHHEAIAALWQAESVKHPLGAGGNRMATAPASGNKKARR
jgi:hypothetical protein